MDLQEPLDRQDHLANPERTVYRVHQGPQASQGLQVNGALQEKMVFQEFPGNPESREQLDIPVNPENLERQEKRGKEENVVTPESRGSRVFLEKVS